MGRIAVSELVTLDWVVEDPGGGEGFEHGGWVLDFDQGEEGRQVKYEEIFDAEALLMGRVTYEGLARCWPGREDDNGYAAKLNAMPKFVVSSTLEEPEWENTTVLRGAVVEQVAMLKQELEGEILVPGSPQLVRTLFEEDLLDELRIMMFGCVLGVGKRLFPPGVEAKPMRLARRASVGEGVAYFVFEPREEGAREDAGPPV